MRASSSLTMAALTAALWTGSSLTGAALAAPQAPLAAPMGVTYTTVEPQLPPGVTPEQAAMARQMGYLRNVAVFADVDGKTLYQYDPAPKLSSDSTIGVLVDNEDSKAVLEKHFPGISTNPALGQARSLTLKAVKQFLPGLTDEKLKTIDTELAAIEVLLDPANALCTGECAEKWPPFLAREDAQPVGLWSIVQRPDGKDQWAFEGKPLHTYVEDDKPGIAKGDKAEGKWNQAVRKDMPGFPMPVGVSVDETMKFDGKVLLNPDGMTLYTFDRDKPGVSNCEGQCARIWPPFEAPRLAVPVGDFSVISRNDGIKQWAYKGMPLYTFTGDDESGDAHGDGVADVWHQAELVRYYFPSDVEVREHPKHGPMLSTTDGHTLYARDAHRFTLAGGSHDDRNALRGNPDTGARIGLSGCQGECLDEFKPHLASADAQPWGDWTIIERPDGSRQWAYRAFPLFTYVGDEEPGDAYAHDMYELTDGTTGLFWRVALP